MMNIPVQLDRMPQGVLIGMAEAGLCNANQDYSSTICANYWKGPGQNRYQMVMEIDDEVRTDD